MTNSISIAAQDQINSATNPQKDKDHDIIFNASPIKLQILQDVLNLKESSPSKRETILMQELKERQMEVNILNLKNEVSVQQKKIIDQKDEIEKLKVEMENQLLAQS